MDFEWIDIVDENDCIVEKIQRTHAWEKSNEKGIYRSVAVFAFTPQNKFVLQQRSKLKNTAPLLFTASASGHVPSGYTYYDAALKETEEELGRREDLKEIGVLALQKNGETKRFIGVFTCTLSGPLNYDEAEVERLVEIDLHDLERVIQLMPFMFTGAFKSCYAFYKEALEKTQQKDQTSLNPSTPNLS